MENLLNNLSLKEMQQIQGGEITTYTYKDAEGYYWRYVYNSGRLVSIMVSEVMCS